MEGFFSVINDGLVAIDDFIWGVPLMVLILFGGILLTVRLRAVQFRQLPRALRYMVKNEKGGAGEVSSFGALCTALSATIGTGNIVGVATAIVAGGPGALFWMWLAALFGVDRYVLAVNQLDFRGNIGKPDWFNPMSADQPWFASAEFLAEDAGIAAGVARKRAVPELEVRYPADEYELHPLLEALVRAQRP